MPAYKQRRIGSGLWQSLASPCSSGNHTGKSGRRFAGRQRYCRFVLQHHDKWLDKKVLFLSVQVVHGGVWVCLCGVGPDPGTTELHTGKAVLEACSHVHVTPTALQANTGPVGVFHACSGCGNLLHSSGLGLGSSGAAAAPTSRQTLRGCSCGEWVMGALYAARAAMQSILESKS